MSNDHKSRPTRARSRCPDCGSSVTIPLATPPGAEHECAACGTVFRTPRAWTRAQALRLHQHTQHPRPDAWIVSLENNSTPVAAGPIAREALALAAELGFGERRQARPATAADLDHLVALGHAPTTLGIAEDATAPWWNEPDSPALVQRRFAAENAATAIRLDADGHRDLAALYHAITVKYHQIAEHIEPTHRANEDSDHPSPSDGPADHPALVQRQFAAENAATANRLDADGHHDLAALYHETARKYHHIAEPIESSHGANENPDHPSPPDEPADHR